MQSPRPMVSIHTAVAAFRPAVDSRHNSADNALCVRFLEELICPHNPFPNPKRRDRRWRPGLSLKGAFGSLPRAAQSSMKAVRWSDLVSWPPSHQNVVKLVDCLVHVRCNSARTPPNLAGVLESPSFLPASETASEICPSASSFLNEQTIS